MKETAISYDEEESTATTEQVSLRKTSGEIELDSNTGHTEDLTLSSSKSSGSFMIEDDSGAPPPAALPEEEEEDDGGDNASSPSQPRQSSDANNLDDRNDPANYGVSRTITPRRIPINDEPSSSSSSPKPPRRGVVRSSSSIYGNVKMEEPPKPDAERRTPPRRRGVGRSKSAEELPLPRRGALRRTDSRCEGDPSAAQMTRRQPPARNASRSEQYSNEDLFRFLSGGSAEHPPPPADAAAEVAPKTRGRRRGVARAKSAEELPISMRSSRAAPRSRSLRRTDPKRPTNLSPAPSFDSNGEAAELAAAVSRSPVAAGGERRRGVMRAVSAEELPIPASDPRTAPRRGSLKRTVSKYDGDSAIVRDVAPIRGGSKRPTKNDNDQVYSSDHMTRFLSDDDEDDDNNKEQQQQPIAPLPPAPRRGSLKRTVSKYDDSSDREAPIRRGSKRNQVYSSEHLTRFLADDDDNDNTKDNDAQELAEAATAAAAAADGAPSPRERRDAAAGRSPGRRRGVGRSVSAEVLPIALPPAPRRGSLRRTDSKYDDASSAAMTSRAAPVRRVSKRSEVYSAQDVGRFLSEGGGGGGNDTAPAPPGGILRREGGGTRSPPRRRGVGRSVSAEELPVSAPRTPPRRGVLRRTDSKYDDGPVRAAPPRSGSREELYSLQDLGRFLSDSNGDHEDRNASVPARPTRRGVGRTKSAESLPISAPPRVRRGSLRRTESKYDPNVRSEKTAEEASQALPTVQTQAADSMPSAPLRRSLRQENSQMSESIPEDEEGTSSPEHDDNTETCEDESSDDEATQEETEMKEPIPATSAGEEPENEGTIEATVAEVYSEGVEAVEREQQQPVDEAGESKTAVVDLMSPSVPQRGALRQLPSSNDNSQTQTQTQTQETAPEDPHAASREREAESHVSYEEGEDCATDAAGVTTSLESVNTSKEQELTQEKTTGAEMAGAASMPSPPRRGGLRRSTSICRSPAAGGRNGGSITPPSEEAMQQHEKENEENISASDQQAYTTKKQQHELAQPVLARTGSAPLPRSPKRGCLRRSPSICRGPSVHDPPSTTPAAASTGGNNNKSGGNGEEAAGHSSPALPPRGGGGGRRGSLRRTPSKYGSKTEPPPASTAFQRRDSSTRNIMYSSEDLNQFLSDHSDHSSRSRRT